MHAVGYMELLASGVPVSNEVSELFNRSFANSHAPFGVSGIEAHDIDVDRVCVYVCACMYACVRLCVFTETHPLPFCRYGQKPLQAGSPIS